MSGQWLAVPVREWGFSHLHRLQRNSRERDRKTCCGDTGAEAGAHCRNLRDRNRIRRRSAATSAGDPRGVRALRNFAFRCSMRARAAFRVGSDTAPAKAIALYTASTRALICSGDIRLMGEGFMVVAGSSDSRVLDLLGFHVAGLVKRTLQVWVQDSNRNNPAGLALNVQCERLRTRFIAVGDVSKVPVGRAATLCKSVTIDHWHAEEKSLEVHARDYTPSGELRATPLSEFIFQSSDGVIPQ